MRFNLSVFQKGLILVCTPMFFLIFFVSALFFLVRQSEIELQHQVRAKEIHETANSLGMLFYEAAYALANIASSATPQKLESLQDVVSQLPKVRQRLRDLLADSTEELESYDGVEAAIDDITLVLSDFQRRAYADPAGATSREKIDNIKLQLETLTERFTKRLKEFLADTRRLNEEGPSIQRHNAGVLKNLLFAIVFLTFMLAFALLIYFRTELLGRLQIVLDNTKRLSKQEMLLPQMDGSDEISQLDHEFHTMANALTVAQEKERATREELDRVKEEFYAMITHDLRSPLQSIGGALELLAVGAKGELPAPALQIIEVAERSTQRLANLVNDLLDLAKLEAGRFEMSFAETSLMDVISRSQEAIQQMLKDSEIKLGIPTDDINVNADSDRLVQVVVNLLSNAVKFSPKGGSINVSITAIATNVRLSVSDNGPGIPVGQLNHLFERFKQVGNKEERKGGTGLGLAICKQIIEQHNGRIGVESEVGRGSTFWFELPLRAEPQ